MKFKNNSKVVLTPKSVASASHHSKSLENKKVWKEILMVIGLISIIYFWIRCCMTMGDPIFLNKALICSFIIVASIFLKKVAD
jgi:hypothetical protein